MEVFYNEEPEDDCCRYGRLQLPERFRGAAVITAPATTNHQFTEVTPYEEPEEYCCRNGRLQLYARLCGNAVTEA